MKRAELILLLILPTLFITCSGPKLMPYKKFSAIQDLGLPKELKLTAGQKELLYIGTYHSNNQEDTIFTFIQDRLDEFKPDYVLHEGGANWPIFPQVDSTILVSGESGFIIYQSKKEGIDYGTIEPDETAEYKHLLATYDLDWVVLMYFCRQIDQQQRFSEAYHTTDADFVKNMNYFLSMLSQNGIPLQNEQLNYHYWEKKYEDLLKKELAWRTFNPTIYYPNYNLSKLNEINRSSDEFRNAYMVERILKQFEEDNKVFVLVGGGHLIIQEALLRHNFNQKYD